MKHAAEEKFGFYSLLSIAIGLLVIMAWPFFHAELYASYDFYEVFIPERAFYSLALERGEIGLWIPHFWRGVDQIAYGQTGSFHPLHMAIYSIFSLPIAVAIEMVIHYPISMLGAFLFLRSSFSYGKIPAMFGACLFAFSVFPMAHFGHLHMCLIYAHMPYFCWAVERQVRGRKPFFSACSVGLIVASMLLLCHPQITFLVMLSGGVLWVYLSILNRNSWSLVRTGILTIGIVGGVLVGMLQLQPTMDAFKNTDRANLTEVERQNFSLPPKVLLTNLNPGLFGRKGTTDSVVVYDESQKVSNPSEFSAYLGIGVLTLLWCCLWRRFDRYWYKTSSNVFLVACVLILLLLMVGRYGGLNRLVGFIPLVSQFRCPNRYKIVLSAMIYLFATTCVARLLSRIGEKTCAHHGNWGVYIPTAMSAITGLALLNLKTAGLIDGEWNILTGVIWGVLVSCLVASAFLLYEHRGGLWLSMIMVLCMVDLAMFGIPKMKLGGYVPYAEVNALKSNMGEPKDYRIVTQGNRFVWGGEYMALGYLGMLPNESLNYGVGWHNQLASVRALYPPNRIMVEVPPPVFPRFRLAPNLVPQPYTDMETCPPPELGQTAWASDKQELCFSGPILQPDETVEVEEDGFTQIRLAVNVAHKRLLVCSDRWHEGWSSTVNGEDTPIIPLFGDSMRGIIVPPGTSKVVMYYRPPALKRGKKMALVGAVLLSILMILDAWKLKIAGLAKDPQDGFAEPIEE